MTLELALSIILEALFGYLTIVIVNFIKTKGEEVKAKTNNEIATKYTDMIVDTVSRCVVATNQTYVNSLKNQGNFNIEAQEKAFQMTLDTVLAILSDDAKAYINETTGDITTYLTQLIEAQVATEKK